MTVFHSFDEMFNACSEGYQSSSSSSVVFNVFHPVTPKSGYFRNLKDEVVCHTYVTFVGKPSTGQGNGMCRGIGIKMEFVEPYIKGAQEKMRRFAQKNGGNAVVFLTEGSNKCSLLLNFGGYINEDVAAKKYHNLMLSLDDYICRSTSPNADYF